jgi:hypothetical protein
VIRPRTLAVLALGLVALVFLWLRLEARLAGGASLGYLLGATLALGSALRLGRIVARAPDRALGTQVKLFLVKLAVLLAAVLALRFLAPLGERVDWRAFVIGMAAALALLAPLAALDVLGGKFRWHPRAA